MRVVRVVPVVPAHEDAALRHDQAGKNVAGLLVDEGLDAGDSVDEQHAPFHLDLVPGHRHHPLDEHVVVEQLGQHRSVSFALVPVERGVEDDDVAGARRPRPAVGQLLGHEAVADVEAREHRQRRDKAGLGDEGADAEGDGEGRGVGDEVLAVGGEPVAA